MFMILATFLVSERPYTVVVVAENNALNDSMPTSTTFFTREGGEHIDCLSQCECHLFNNENVTAKYTI